MALSRSEVMYGAYYPYLYGRGARSFHHAPHFQYDRFTSGAGGGGGGGAAYGGAVASSGSPAASASASPGSPLLAPRLRAKEEELSAHGRASADGVSSESETECSGGTSGGASGGTTRRAQYVSANCVVFTHYAGDAAASVDEHFTRALHQDKHKEGVVPMVSRNLPASFFNAAAMAAGTGMSAMSGMGTGAGCMDLYEYDPWAQHYNQYTREYHQGYGGLLLGRAVPQYKPVDWSQQHIDHHHPSHCNPYSYPAMPGLEAPVQDGSKDLYWF